MTYNLSNNCAKNVWKRTILVQIIVEDAVTFFWNTLCEHDVVNVAVINVLNVFK